MNINRHNYEEFFILYMDNELNSEDRRMVELFVQQHPDLKEELDLLLHYKLEPDTSISFAGKEELMKVNGATPVTLTNYEEWFVLYIDNELSADRRKEVEAFIKDNPAVKEEFRSLERSKLQPETIVFANKESLYRREEKVRVVPFRFWRVAAAILIIALGITTVVVLNRKPTLVTKNGNGVADVNPGKNNTINPVVKEEQPVRSTNPAVTDNSTDKSVNSKSNVLVKTNEVIQPEKQNVQKIIKQQDKNMAVTNNKPVITNKPVNQPLPEKKEQVIVDVTNKPNNNLPVPVNNPNVIKNNDVPKNSVATNNTPKESNKTQEPVLTDPVVTKVIPASYNSTGEQLEEGSNNKKSRGLFRKIARTFDKRTNMSDGDDNRLLVAGLSFKLK